MFTPQQLEQITFHTSVFGGYDMDSVDEFLVALIEDYNTLYKDNATLKSKMRVLVEKLEEFDDVQTVYTNMKPEISEEAE